MANKIQEIILNPKYSSMYEVDNGPNPVAEKAENAKTAIGNPLSSLDQVSEIVPPTSETRKLYD